MIGLEEDLLLQLQKRHQEGHLRALKEKSPYLIDFASNDYLGFIHDRLLHALIEQEKKRLKEDDQVDWYGAGGSRLLTGHSKYCHELEMRIAAFHQAEAGLLFNSGYVANLGLISSVISNEDTVIFDQASHASLYDALKMKRANIFPFRHQNLDHLKKRLQKAKKRTFVCVESVYSCDGSETDLEEVIFLCEQFGAHLIVDEAHATGYIGSKGQGSIVANNLQQHVFARVHTFGKALGCQGAIVLGNHVLRDYLINFARPFIYTTAMPLQNLITIECAYQALERFSNCQFQLKRNIQLFNAKAKNLSFSSFYHTPIKSLKMPGNHAVRHAALILEKKGYDVRPLFSPTVRRGEECLRICLHAFNTSSEIEALIELLHCFIKERGR